MPAASILIKPVSSNCNLNCQYCFYKCLCENRKEYSKGIMEEKTLEELIKQGISYAEGYITFAFQGGEPMLAGLDFYKKVVEFQQKYNQKNLIIENTIQTNGVLLDEEWAAFFAENHFLTGISLDGPAKIHDAYRKDSMGGGTFHQVIQGVGVLERYGAEYNIVTVVTSQTAKKAAYLYKFYKKHHFSFVQLIPCMDEGARWKQQAAADFAIEAKDYGRFLSQIFDLWYGDFMRGETMEIRMFSNLAAIAAGYQAEECGMNGSCNCYFAVEGDGSVYPCDFYCTDPWRLGSLKDSFQTLYQSEKAEEFRKSSLPLPSKCRACLYVSLCKGGCKRFRESFDGTELTVNYLCEAYEIFFSHTWERLMVLGEMIKKKMK